MKTDGEIIAKIIEDVSKKKCSRIVSCKTS